MRHCVYALIDPRSDEIFYIGQTSDLGRRRAEHLDGTDQLSGVKVRQIKLAGFLPLVAVLERAKTIDAILAAEIFWIELARSRGMKLLNAQAVGGYVTRKQTRNTLERDLADMADLKAATITHLKSVANARPSRITSWSPKDLRRLAGMRHAGMSAEAMADALGRSLADVRRQLRAGIPPKGKRQ